MTTQTLNVDGHAVTIETTGDALFMSIDGCADAVSEPGKAVQLRLDWYYDEPTLYVWPDKHDEDPQIISLARCLADA